MTYSSIFGGEDYDATLRADRLDAARLRRFGRGPEPLVTTQRGKLVAPKSPNPCG
ncbi:MAG: hypothetical protein ACLUNS_01330 [Alistipes shahii]